MYDPLVDKHTPSGQPRPNSYWQAVTAMPEPATALAQDTSTETLIIGAGLTGLSCGYYAQQQGMDAMIIDANQPGWGCSGRNAGFILPGSGRLDYTGLKQGWGDNIADNTLAQYYAALDTIAELRDATENDCDIITGGYLKIGHSANAFQQLRAGMQALPAPLQAQYEEVSANDLQRLLPDYASYGGILRPQGQGLNPLKFSLALTAQLQNQGGHIYGDTPALDISKNGKGYSIVTPGGTITASHLVICSNAYSLPGLFKPVTSKQFPVLSSVLVTSPLPEHVARQWQAGLMAMDTRSLKYYFRLLPDNRLLFGGRGAITGKQANTPGSQLRLKQAFNRYFPQLSALNVDYFWSGWVSVSADSIPHITRVGDENIHYATGYCGSGLSFSCHAGKLLSQSLLGKPAGHCAFDSPIPAFPFVPFRRLGLYGFYLWHRLTD